MTALDREEALDFAVKLARHVGREIQMPRLKARPDKKGIRDLVTEADRLSERAIVVAIRERYPGHAIYAEEEVREEARAAEYTWYVDPLDGTTNFVHGLPLFCVSIACYRTALGVGAPPGGPPADPEPEVGVVYAPYLDECFFGARGLGAYLNCLPVGGRAPSPLRGNGDPATGVSPAGTLPVAQQRGPAPARRFAPDRAEAGATGPAPEAIRLRVTEERRLIDALVVTGFAYDQQRFPNVAAFGRMVAKTRGVRRLGSAALDIAYVAAGRFDAFWEPGLNSFDLAAGALFVMEAGGRVTDYDGGADWLHGRRIVCSNGGVHEAVLRELRAAG